jgi:uncharacterized protein (DUF305 family)
MKHRWIGITGLAFVLAALVGGSLWPGAFWSGQSSTMMGPGMMNGGMMSGQMGPGMMSEMMSGMMNAGPADSNAPFDQRFFDQMIVHHQGAVMSAQMMIADSARPELRDLAQRIITGQQREIGQMRQWRADWYGARNAGSMPDMMGGGMMGSMNRDQMRQMMGASADFDQMFLQMMIPHHKAAITMAGQALNQGEHPEIKTFVQGTVATQRAEITEMQGYLSEWYGVQLP